MPQMGIPLGHWASFRLRCAPFPEQFALSDPAGQRVAQPFLYATPVAMLPRHGASRKPVTVHSVDPDTLP